jgi:hypothetical protein
MVRFLESFPKFTPRRVSPIGTLGCQAGKVFTPL